MLLPPGVTLQQIDGGTGYYTQWANAFPAAASFFPVGVFPAEALPSDLAAIGINYFTPMRNDAAGTWCPVWSNTNGDDMTHVNAQPGFYAGAAFYSEISGMPWGSRAVFEVFGDELDGNAGNFFNCASANIKANNQAGTWGGLTAAAFTGAIGASKSDDPSRPTYIQVTTALMDGTSNYNYSLAEKQSIAAATNLFSFDIYPIVKRNGNVYDTYDQVTEARGYCLDARPVFPFIEMDHQDNGAIYPTPAQTVAEVWNAIIAGARGVQYFDQYGNITNPAYTGGGHYAAGAMYDAISAVNAQLQELAPVLNSPFANGYVTSGSSGVRYMAKYYSSTFYVFASSHQDASQSVTFTAAGGYSGPVTVTGESRTVTASSGTFTDTFASATDVHIYEIPAVAMIQNANTNHAYNSGNTVITPGVATTAGNTLIVTGSISVIQSGADSLNVTDSAGNTWTIGTTNIPGQDPPVAWDSSNTFGAFVAWCINAAAVTTVTVTSSAGPFEYYALDATLSEWAGLTRLASSSAATGATGTIEPPAVTLAASSDVVAAAACELFTSTLSPGAGLTQFSSDSTGNTAYAQPGAPGSFQPQWGTSSHPWAAAAAVFTSVPPAAGTKYLTGSAVPALISSAI